MIVSRQVPRNDVPGAVHVGLAQQYGGRLGAAGYEGVCSFAVRYIVERASARRILRSRPDQNVIIRRLQAYQEAGADVLDAPGVSSKAQIEWNAMFDEQARTTWLLEACHRRPW
jgi:hypothetical protein